MALQMLNFGVSKKFKVRKFDLILSTSLFIFNIQLRAVLLIKHHVIYNLGQV